MFNTYIHFEKRFSADSAIILIVLLCSGIFSFSTQAQYREVDSLKLAFQNSSEDTTKIHFCTSVASSYYTHGIFDSSEIYAKRGIELYEKTEQNIPKKNKLVATIYYSYNFNTLGLINNIKGNYPDALKYLFKGVEIAEKTGDWGTLARCYGNIAMIFHNQTETKKALVYYDKALKIYEKKNLTYGIAMCTLNRGLCYEAEKDTNEALRSYETARKLAEEIKEPSMLSVAASNIANIYAYRKQYTEAVQYMEQAHQLTLKYQTAEHISRSYNNLGLLYANMKSYQKAYEYMYRGLKLSDSVNNKSSLKAAYENLSYLYEKSDRALPDTFNGKMLSIEQTRLRALEFYKHSVRLEKEMEGEESRKKALEQEARFEFDKKETIANAQRDKEKSEEEMRDKRNKLIIAVICIILGIVAFFTYMVWKSLKITKEQKKLIEEQKHLVEEKQKEILDSITYARRIQKALITSEFYILKNLNRIK